MRPDAAGPVLAATLAWLDRAARRPLVVGLQAPQGAGKTTLVVYLLEEPLRQAGVRGASVSIDDFYLTRDEQVALAASHPANPYLEHRGYPGTHDLELGTATLDALRRLGPASAGESVLVPIYDKSAHGGRGNRAPRSAWRRVSGPLDVVFVDGWMLGFTPVPEATLTDPDLVAPNRALAGYSPWHSRLDAFVEIRAIDPTSVLRWRVEAEDAMRAAGRPALGHEAIEDYVRRFLPAYATWSGIPPNIPDDRRLTLWIDDARRVVDR